MIIKVKKTWKDFVEGPKHTSWTRRDFMMRGLQTGALSVALPKLLGAELIRSAYAGTLNCPKAVAVPGAIAQIYASGGPTMGARFFGEAQAAAAAMSTTMANNYGITGTNLLKLGPGLVIDSTSVFGQTLLQGPPGFPGGMAAWKTNVLANLCAGGHLGPFNADDGAGLNSGLMGSVSLDKASLIGKDFRLSPAGAQAAWTNGTPAITVDGALAPAGLITPFNLNPPPTGVTTQAEMTNAASGAIAISQALDPMLHTLSRKGSSNMLTSVGCALFGNAALTDTTFGAKLFDPTLISNLTSNMTVASLTSQEQALLAAFYQSAAGIVGGVTMGFSGRDYHGRNPQTSITPVDVEDARTVVMFLAACYSAQKPGALIYVSNGQAVANGVSSVTATINGASVTMNCPVAMGDAGGLYNAGLIMFYSPTGPGGLPTPRYSGTLNTTTGGVAVDSKVASSANALAGLYLSAHQYISGTMPPSLLKRLQSANLAAIPKDLLVI